MKTARNISWEIRGRRLVEGAMVDQHVATGFGPDAASAIRWARRNEPAKTASFPDADLRAIPDPISSSTTQSCSTTGRRHETHAAGYTLPVVASLLAGFVVLACVCVGCGGQPISSAPVVFHAADGSSAVRVEDSQGSTRGPGKLFDRDTLAALVVFGCSIAALFYAGIQLDKLDREESARRVREMEDRL